MQENMFISSFVLSVCKNLITNGNCTLAYILEVIFCFEMENDMYISICCSTLTGAILVIEIYVYWVMDQLI